MAKRYDDDYRRRGYYPTAPTVGEKRAKAASSVAKLEKKGKQLQPVVIEGRAIATSWWGKAWCRNLELYADYSNRIGRGRSYVRSGAVIDLRIGKGVGEALVQGSRVKPYKVVVTIAPLSERIWDQIVKRCNRSIATLEALAGGTFPKELGDLFNAAQEGLFPAPREIDFTCTCPDWASMCKHVAAVLYAIGNRLDSDPLLFFTLRDIDFSQLIKRSVDEKVQSMLAHAAAPSTRKLSPEEAAKLFGL